MQEYQATMETWIGKTWLKNTCLELVRREEAGELLEAERGLLSPEASLKRQREFSAGRHAARLALKNFGLPDWPVLRNEHRVPEWPQGFVGSISHSHSLAAAIVARQSDYMGLGLDLEDLSRPRNTPLEKLAEKILTAAECKQLANSLSYELLLTYFSAKEALFKAVYPLVQKDFWHHDAELRQISREIWQAELMIDLSDNFPKGTLINLKVTSFENYCLSLCYLEQPAK